MSTMVYPLTGRCACGQIRYQLETAPMIVHCCHCTWCQRETGSSFALNAPIEADRVTILTGEPKLVSIPSASGEGQVIARCPECYVAVWSNYSWAGPLMRMIRVGTLDRAGSISPVIHIYTADKQAWVVIPEGAPSAEVYYDDDFRKLHWSEDSLQRREVILSKIEKNNGWSKGESLRGGV